MKVLYEDNHLIAVFKPVGVLSQGDKTGDISIFDEVKKYLKEKYNKPGRVFLGLLHRLDRPVSGIMLFAKTSKGASRLSEQFRNHKIEKVYHAIVVGKPRKDKGILVNYLKKNQKKLKSKSKNITYQSDSAPWGYGSPYGSSARIDKSKLWYEIIKSNENPTSLKLRGINKVCYTLLKIKIETGRFHQIRAQLSMAGFSILGDVKYGGQKWNDEKSIALCATNLSFRTATGEKIINIKIDLPKEWSDYI